MPKIILLKDVVKVGQKGDIKEVKDGFYRNYLLPNKLAELATKDKIKRVESELAMRAQNKKEKEEKGAKEIDKLKNKTLVFSEKTSEKGKLYDSISAKEISEKLSEEGIAAIPFDWIKLEKPFKDAGDYTVSVESPFSKKAELKIQIKKQ